MYKILVGCGLALGSVALTVPAGAAPIGGHCPPAVSGYIRWDVNTEPYQADNLVDAAGNNNGTVCAKPGRIVVDENGNDIQTYNFIEDRGNGSA